MVDAGFAAALAKRIGEPFHKKGRPFILVVHFELYITPVFRRLRLHG
jgi:hypothetical protein